ncbi:MAG TPA: site-2 protease family protein [Ktedonobacterales bacterium]|nr:site-2 protease family protein [Ktedonobacterales bacterium]
MAETDDQWRNTRPTQDGAPAGSPSYPTSEPPILPGATNQWDSEWFAPPPGWKRASTVPAYPPSPEYYQAGAGALPVVRSANALPSSAVEPVGAENAAYPAYAPGGVVDAEGLRDAPNPHQAAGRGRPEAAGCASGAAIVGLLSKLLIGAKFLLPLLSAAVSFALYTALFGWQFALGIIALLFVHEMGHFVVIRAKGMPASLPVFIPLLGAYVAMQRMPHNVRDEAEIGIAGPLTGALGGLACLGIYFETHLPIMVPLAYFSFLINLLNLVPVAPLDGARVTAAISRWFWPIGLIMLAVGVYYTQSIFLVLIGLIGFFQMIERFRASPAQRAYYAVSPLVRVYITTLYFGLIASLALALFFSQSLLPATGGGLL